MLYVYIQIHTHTHTLIDMNYLHLRHIKPMYKTNETNTMHFNVQSLGEAVAF